MVIICTVLAGAAPSLRGFFASRETADAAAQIVALTQFARSASVSEGRRYRLNFDKDAGVYWLTAQEKGAFENIGSEFGRVFSLPKGGRLALESTAGQVAESRVTFYPSGRIQPARIRLTGRQGEMIDVVCESPTELFHVASSEEAE